MLAVADLGEEVEVLLDDARPGVRGAVVQQTMYLHAIYCVDIWLGACFPAWDLGVIATSTFDGDGGFCDKAGVAERKTRAYDDTLRRAVVESLDQRRQ